MGTDAKREIGNYVIHDELGRGGMGVVYRASDTRLGREVALKVLSEQIAGDPSRLARFEREARAVAAVSHPSILAVHEFGQCDRGPYIVMELLEGETLRARLTSGRLPTQNAVEFARQISEGVAAAHEKGIIHRDIKPENVFITESGRVKILDFGLATTGRFADFVTMDATVSMARLTQEGSTLGTPGYMAPEQVRGDDADGRADLFAIGVVLFEMLAGRPAFSGRTVGEVLSAILTQDPLEDNLVEISSALSVVLRRCLEKNRGERFQSASDLEFALRTIDVAEQRSGSRPGVAPRSQDSPSIAVLPFVNQSPDPENEYFADGVSEEIMNTLSRIEGLRVAARTSSFAFKGASADIEDVGRRLNVSTVLEGSVRKSGDRIRINAQLVDVTNGFQLWSERFDRRLTDIFEVQDEIAQSIAATLALTLGVSPGTGPSSAPTDNIAAYEQYLKGRQRAGLGYGMDLFNALECFERAIELDANFAAAYAGLSEIYSTLGYMAALPPRIAMPKAKQAAERALAMNESLAEAHCALACVEMSYEWKWENAGERFHRAIDLNPNFTQTYYHLGHVFYGFVDCNIEKGIAICRSAVERDPLATYPLHGLIASLYMAGQHDEAIMRADEALEKDPSAFHFHRLVGLCQFERGAHDAALHHLQEAVRISGRHPWALYEVASIAASMGDLTAAENIYAEMNARRTTFYMPSMPIATLAAWLGRFDEAFSVLDQALEERDGIIYAITTWPMARPLWDKPRYQDLLSRLGLNDPRA